MIWRLKVLTASGRDGLRPVRSIWPRRSATLPLCSGVLASTDYPIRFSPVVDALCRLSPRNRVTKGRIHRYQRSQYPTPSGETPRKIPHPHRKLKRKLSTCADKGWEISDIPSLTADREHVIFFPEISTADVESSGKAESWIHTYKTKT